MKKIFIALLAILALSSCRDNGENENNIIIRANGSISQNETIIFKNPSEYYTRDLTMDAPLNLAEKKHEIENLLTKFDEIDMALVVVLENRAIIGVLATPNADTELLKKEIQKLVRANIDSIIHVNVTFDAELIERLDIGGDFHAFKYLNFDDSTKM
ncbi:MAG: YhcN/YlaJ family sporulation lipoprotein [Defluviitaleaceae bacterium]|nr:YhcN/YlaJ family sporulation lipoprotein [Defluviitaleaceae bacterium]